MVNKDPIIVIACVIILLIGVGVSTVLHEQEDNDDIEETSSGDMLDATRAYLGSGKSTMITAEALYPKFDI